MKRESDKALSDDQIRDIMKWRKEFHLKYDQKMASNAKSPRGKHFDSNTKNKYPYFCFIIHNLSYDKLYHTYKDLSSLSSLRISDSRDSILDSSFSDLSKAFDLLSIWRLHVSSRDFIFSCISSIDLAIAILSVQCLQ